MPGKYTNFFFKKRPFLALKLALILAGAVAGMVFIVGFPSNAEIPDNVRREFPKTDFNKIAIDFNEILSGGPPKDGIPAIDTPSFISVSKASSLKNSAFLGENEPVVSIKIGNDARAYPIRILIWHEIVNDVIANKPVAITFCPLCNSVVVFDATLKGQQLDFGTTGRLRMSDLVMYDRQTESWWQQITGQAIIGRFAGQKLKVLPSRLEAWAEFREANPGGKVLIPSNQKARNYGLNPYARYDQSARPFLFSGKLPEDIPPLERVVSLQARDRAWSFPHLAKKGEITQDGIIISWKPGQNSALDSPDIAKGRDVGTVRARRQREDGGFEDVPYFVEFAFAFHAFYPKSPIIHE